MKPTKNPVDDNTYKHRFIHELPCKFYDKYLQVYREGSFACVTLCDNDADVISSIKSRWSDEVLAAIKYWCKPTLHAAFVMYCLRNDLDLAEFIPEAAMAHADKLMAVLDADYEPYKEEQ